MFPNFIKFGPFSIKTYGVFVALGFLFGFIYLRKLAKKAGVSDEALQDIMLYAMVSGLIGARINYVFLNLGFYIKNIWEVFYIWEGGLVFYGGAASAALVLAYYIRKNKIIDLLTFADIAAPALALGHFFGRLGCFFAGCCYGKACSLPWAVSFNHSSALAPLHVPLHPVQLYEAFGNLLIFVILDRLIKINRDKGLIFLLYLLMYPALRFTLEFFRGDDRGFAILGLSIGQLISLLVFVGSLVLIIRRNNSGYEHN